MMSIDTLTTFFGWCAVINIGAILALTLIMSALDKDGFIIEQIVKIFGNTKEDTLATTFLISRQFRLLFFVFNLVPYFALKIMGSQL